MAIDTLRQQLQQLERDLQQGKLARPDYELRRADLERKLVAQVMERGVEPGAVLAAPVAPARPSRKLLAGLAAWVIVVATAGYGWTGSPTALGPPAAPPIEAAQAPGLEQITAMADKLAARLRDKPDDALGWAMLARSYSVLGRNAEALPAYAKAVALKGDDAGLLSDYAAELAMQNQRDMTGQPLELVQRALVIDPNNLKALSLAGMAAFDRKDYAGAVRQWEKILQLSPADPELVQQVQASVAEARELGKLPASSSATTAQPAASTPQPAAAAAVVTPAAGNTTVSGVVTLSPALAAQVSPSDTVFVFARPAEGARMPLAVVRKQVKDLPLEFTLDDSLAMSPAAKLSMHPRVVVSARITKSGNAIPQPGDLVGAAIPVALGASGVRIEIAQTVPN